MDTRIDATMAAKWLEALQIYSVYEADKHHAEMYDSWDPADTRTLYTNGAEFTVRPLAETDPSWRRLSLDEIVKISLLSLDFYAQNEKKLLKANIESLYQRLKLGNENNPHTLIKMEKLQEVILYELRGEKEIQKDSILHTFTASIDRERASQWHELLKEFCDYQTVKSEAEIYDDWNVPDEKYFYISETKCAFLKSSEDKQSLYPLTLMEVLGYTEACISYYNARERELVLKALDLLKEDIGVCDRKYFLLGEMIQNLKNQIICINEKETKKQTPLEKLEMLYALYQEKIKLLDPTSVAYWFACDRADNLYAQSYKMIQKEIPGQERANAFLLNNYLNYMASDIKSLSSNQAKSTFEMMANSALRNRFNELQAFASKFQKEAEKIQDLELFKKSAMAHFSATVDIEIQKLTKQWNNEYVPKGPLGDSVTALLIAMQTASRYCREVASAINGNPAVLSDPYLTNKIAELLDPQIDFGDFFKRLNQIHNEMNGGVKSSESTCTSLRKQLQELMDLTVKPMSFQEMRKAYRQWILKHHSDKNQKNSSEGGHVDNASKESSNVGLVNNTFEELERICDPKSDNKF